MLKVCTVCNAFSISSLCFFTVKRDPPKQTEYGIKGDGMIKAHMKGTVPIIVLWYVCGWASYNLILSSSRSQKDPFGFLSYCTNQTQSRDWKERAPFSLQKEMDWPMSIICAHGPTGPSLSPFCLLLFSISCLKPNISPFSPLGVSKALLYPD